MKNMLNNNNNNIILRAKKVTKKFPGTVALKDFDFELFKGEVHALVGENGAGKSTFIKLLSGVYKPDEGEIKIENEVVTHFTPKVLLGKGVGTVFQELSLVPQLTIEENIFLGKENTRFGVIDSKRRTELTLRYLEEVGFNISPKTVVESLRAGEKRIVEIICALSENPKILIFDEPTEALTDEQTTVLFKIIEKLKKDEVGIIYISHKLSEIFKVANRVTVLRDGVSRGTFNINEVDMEKLVKLMVGREIKDLFPERETRSYKKEDIILEIKDLNVKGILKHISFQLSKGEILGISGLVGAGRTEIVMAIMGLLPIEGGEIIFKNKVLHHPNPETIKNLGIGIIPEDRYSQGLVQYMSVRDNIILSSLHKKDLSGMIFLKERIINSKVRDLVNSLDIKVSNGNINMEVMSLSGGNQQKVVIAKNLCLNSDLIIFDEPTQGIDVATKYEVYKLVKDLSLNGVSIMLISSDMKEILGLTDRVLVIRKGEIVASYLTENTTEEMILKDALRV
ncbi:MAG: sugar ABC transporter ATP-binding protein [Actinobacteria bacterium]|nr:sugar ABC transporter ATP-binding protein [Actinomycetota bacterium]